jgi:hypothetical protein
VSEKAGDGLAFEGFVRIEAGLVAGHDVLARATRRFFSGWPALCIPTQPILYSANFTSIEITLTEKRICSLNTADARSDLSVSDVIMISLSALRMRRDSSKSWSMLAPENSHANLAGFSVGSRSSCVRPG